LFGTGIQLRDYNPIKASQDEGALDPMENGRLPYGENNLERIDTVGDDHIILADHFWQDSDYLPSQSDQSWREREALGITTFGKSVAEELVSSDPIQEYIAERNGTGGSRSVTAFFAVVAVIASAVVALTLPDILTVGIWRPRLAATKPAVGSRGALVSAVNIPVRLSLARAAAPKSVVSRTDSAGPTLTVDATSHPNAISEVAPKPRPSMHLVKRTEAGIRSTDGFYALVPEANGTLEYKYFPSKPLH
jgi:hypothetical protein